MQMTFLPSPSIRRILAVPTQDKIDFRAACFCHKTIVDVGFVCSVCLSSKPVMSFNHALFHSDVCLISILSARPGMFNMPVRIYRTSVFVQRVALLLY